MRIFVTGATGALGRHLVPGLVAAGHEVTATTRTPGKVAQLREAGAEPVVLDGLDREAVIAAVMAAAPEVIVHQMTALAGMRSLRKPDKAFAATNELRTWGTDNLLAAAERAGTRRVIAQGYAGAGPDKPSGGALKTEEDPLDWRPIRSAVQGLAAIRHVDKTVPLEAPKGIVLRYGTFYGPGASESRCPPCCSRRAGTGVRWSRPALRAGSVQCPTCCFLHESREEPGSPQRGRPGPSSRTGTVTRWPCGRGRGRRRWCRRTCRA
jgi:nucleoside-diphosphate-sugar epimerase